MGGNFKIKKAAPMDDRGTVAKKIDLQNPNLFDGFTYNGMIVSVVDDTINNGLYRLEDKSTLTWKKEGSDVNFTASLRDKLMKVSDNNRGAVSNETALASIANPMEGDFALVRSTLTFWAYESGAWVDTHSSTTVDLTNYYTKSETYSKVETNSLVATKQDTLVSGNSIKTINGQSVLGNGNIFITAESASPLLQPIITSPANGTVDYIGSITSTYSTSESFVGVQDWVRWEASTDENFTTLIDSYEGSDNLINWTPAIGGLYITTTVYVRTKQGSDNYLSVWSEIISFTTPNTFVETPTITVEGTPNDVPKNPTISGSAFNVYNGVDTLISTDWQVLKASDSSVVWESIGDTVNKTSIKTGDLVGSTSYIFKMRYKGATYGYSQWVQVACGG